jgi:hypothetical protein
MRLMIKRGIGRTVFFLVITTILSMVVIPVLYFFTISFASNYEAYKFPAKILPSFSFHARLKYNEAESTYSLLLKREASTSRLKRIPTLYDFPSICSISLT